MSPQQMPEAAPAVPAAGEAGVVIATASAGQTRDLGERLAALLRAGDLVVLAGGLGAGKTTLAQGIGAGLGVRGRVSSPTFIIARTHPSTRGGPDLIHVDAYRLGSLEEVDALDLDSSLQDSVTLVEWGEDKVESLAAEPLTVEVRRPHGGLEAGTDLDGADDGRRLIVLRGAGERWSRAELETLAEPAGPLESLAGAEEAGSD